MSKIRHDIVSAVTPHVTIHGAELRHADTACRRQLQRYCACALLMLAACASESSNLPTRNVDHPAGFDPRAYYARPALSVRRGAASFYADRFAGRRTANGERYDPDAYTAAHRTLPFNSIVRVVEEQTGDWVLVRINDRGPYGPSKRIIDLSKQAARRLSILRAGVARVRLEVLQLGHE
jgi:rare lipoprotein A (peptidoglycan hydrolase)